MVAYPDSHQAPAAPAHGVSPSRGPRLPPEATGGPATPREPSGSHRSELYEQLMRIQASEALRNAPPSVYRLAVTVAMLSAPNLFASMKRLADHSGLSERVVYAGLKVLEGIGLLPPDRKGWRWSGAKGASPTRLRPVCWDALGPVPDTQRRTGGEQADTPRGEQADTPRGEQADTRKQQGRGFNTEEASTGADQRGFEDGASWSGRVTETRSDTQTVDLSNHIQRTAALERIGLASSLAGRLSMSFGRINPEAIPGALAKLEERRRHSTVRNPAGLFMTILQSDYRSEYAIFCQDRDQENAAVGRGRPGHSSNGSKRTGPPGCGCGGKGICEACMPVVDAGGPLGGIYGDTEPAWLERQREKAASAPVQTPPGFEEA